MIVPTQHRIQTIMVALHVMIIIVGMCILSALEDLLKDCEGARWPGMVRAISRGGLGMLLIPVAWAGLTIYLERMDTGWYRRSWTLLSGITIWLGLAWLFLACIGEVLNPVY